MTEQLKLALTDWFDRLDFDRSNEATRHAEYAELLDIIRAIPPDARVKEALELADKIEGWSPEKWKPLTLIAHERRLAVAALRATPDARVKEALDYIKMADNRLECEGCGQCVSVARSYLVEALAALSHQPLNR